MKRNQVIHITFHNPNSAEDTAKYLTKLLAQSMVDTVIRDGITRRNCAEPPPAAHMENATI